VQGIDVSPDGTLVASGALDGTVRLHSTDGYAVITDQPNMGGVNDLAFSPSEPLLVTTDGQRITGYTVE
jgi:WD40 repeat protein